MKKQNSLTLSLKRQGAFTIIELMIVVSLLAILAAMAVPSFKPMMERENIAAQVNDLISALNLARSEAIRRGVKVTVCRTTDDTTTSTVGSSNAYSLPNYTQCRLSTFAGGPYGNRLSNDWGTGYMVFAETSIAPNATIGFMDGTSINDNLGRDFLIRRIFSIKNNFTIYSHLPVDGRITFNSQGSLDANMVIGGRFVFSGELTSTPDLRRTVCISAGGRIRTVSDIVCN